MIDNAQPHPPSPVIFSALPGRRTGASASISYFSNHPNCVAEASVPARSLARGDRTIDKAELSEVFCHTVSIRFVTSLVVVVVVVAVAWNQNELPFVTPLIVRHGNNRE